MPNCSVRRLNPRIESHSRTSLLELYEVRLGLLVVNLWGLLNPFLSTSVKAMRKQPKST